MKTTSVALFLALSAGYLNAANAASLNNNAAQASKEILTSNQNINSADKRLPLSNKLK